MELLCASCRRRLAYQSLQLCTLWRSSGGRGLHWTPAVLLGKPKLNLEEAAEDVELGSKDVCPPSASGVAARVREEEETVGEPREREVQVEEPVEQEISLAKLPSIYLKLSKSRLTGLVVLTALAGYTMAPAPLHMETLLWASAGTALCSAAANSVNQYVEVPYDSVMRRTRNRVLVRKMISPRHAAIFGLTTGITGGSILWFMVNPLTAVLGVANILLYTAAYTPLKRVSIVNTWVGALVGAIPPVMGWTACTGSLDPGALALAGILYAWQFAHFNALSWSFKGDYTRAGYKMMAVTHPKLCKRVALRYSIAMMPVCALGPVFDVTTWWFVVDTLPLNGWLSYLAWRFYRESDSKSARKLFHFSLFHLPLLMGLMLLNKKRWLSEERTEGDSS